MKHGHPQQVHLYIRFGTEHTFGDMKQYGRVVRFLT